ncbi:MAG: UbiA family prenyltransferase [Chloroflexi bacterium]|nr:UbiA family prenyltransferase [Chloroflexota bacterium]
MLTYIGMAAALFAGGTSAPGHLVVVALALLLGSAGCNGLTNYLDRDVDARMQRTRRRALPSGRILPAWKMLPVAGGLAATGLGLAWLLSPWAFAFGALGILAAVLWRKTGLTHLLGAISGTAPVLVGWYAVGGQTGPTIVVLALLVLIWVPLHVWSLMYAWRDDYWQAGVRIFPLGWPQRRLAWALGVLSAVVAATGLALYFVAGLGLLYLATAGPMALLLVAAGGRLVRQWSAAGGPGSAAALRLFRLATYPYLGLVFLALALEVWL